MLVLLLPFVMWVASPAGSIQAIMLISFNALVVWPVVLFTTVVVNKADVYKNICSSMSAIVFWIMLSYNVCSKCLVVSDSLWTSPLSHQTLRILGLNISIRTACSLALVLSLRASSALLASYTDSLSTAALPLQTLCSMSAFEMC